MGNRENGGLAFPALDSTGSGAGLCLRESGMTLRDYFAAKAMHGICAHSDTWGLSTSKSIAAAAYELADAMITERAA